MNLFQIAGYKRIIDENQLYKRSVSNKRWYIELTPFGGSYLNLTAYTRHPIIRGPAFNTVLGAATGK